MAATDFTLVYGPQGEAVIVPNAEARNWNAAPPETRAVKNDEDTDDFYNDAVWAAWTVEERYQLYVESCARVRVEPASLELWAGQLQHLRSLRKF